MKQRVYIFLFVLLVLTSCTHRPDGIISSGKMSNVLIDLHRTDGLIQIKGYNYGHDAEVAAFYQAVLEKHGVTQAEFDSSLVWYTDHPLQFNRVYPKVLDALEKENAIYTARAEDAQELQRQVRESRKSGWRDWTRKAMETPRLELYDTKPQPMTIYQSPLMPGFTPYVLDTLSQDSVYIPLRIQK